MPSPFARRGRVALFAAAGLLVAAAPVSSVVRLQYDPVVFLAGTCLSPDRTGCNAIPTSVRINASASAALLEAGLAPRLSLDMAGMLDMGPELTGGAAPAASAADIAVGE